MNGNSSTTRLRKKGPKTSSNNSKSDEKLNATKNQADVAAAEVPKNMIDNEILTRRLKEKLLCSEERRSIGDGESVPDTPPNEKPIDDSQTVVTSTHYTSEKKEDVFVYSLNVDGMALTLFLLGLVTRFVSLDQPKNVVFDEMHYGKYASMYLKRVFYFDANPPLGKMLIAYAGYLVGFDGDFEFEKIGIPYSDNVPLWTLRFIPAFCGSVLSPLVYLILCELGLTQWTGLLAGLFVILDTAILAQSKFILLESIMILFALGALYCVLRLRRYQNSPFSLKWWFWIVSASVNMGCAFSVKYLSFYSCTLCCLILLRDFWHRLAIKSLTNKELIFEFFVKGFIVTIVPISIYVGSFYVHLSILTKAGVHDSLMSSAFQASLEGGLSSIVQGQPLQIAHGSQITLRHTHGKTCWLHSHENVYPVKYDDGRGSSHQQQVSCYGYKDVNNWWIVKRPGKEDLAVEEPLDVIRDGDTIQLVHGMTHRALNSHDVAAPMSPHNQEISCYIDYNISMQAENFWKVDIVNKVQDKDVWTSIGSNVRLIHVSTGQALKFSAKLYPEWGYHQNEVVGDRRHDQSDTEWNVEEHQYTKNDEDKKTLERELFNRELIPQTPTYLSFIEKFVELQIKMIVTNQENVQNHNYASDPAEWPFLIRGIAYFISKQSNAQVHLIGNAVLWCSGTLALATYMALLVFYILRRRRHCFDIPEHEFKQFCDVGEILLGGYLIHFLPFLMFYDRTLFIHHYLTAYIYKLMLAAFLITHFHQLIKRTFGMITLSHLYKLATTLWLLGVIYVFWRFSVLAYGTYPLSSDEVKQLQWRNTWNFIIHKP